MTKEVNSLARNTMSSVPVREYVGNTLNLMNLIKMELQSVPTKKLLLVPLLSWFRPSSLPPSGLMLSRLMCTPATGHLLLHCTEKRLTITGQGRSLISHTSVYLDALHMS